MYRGRSSKPKDPGYTNLKLHEPEEALLNLVIQQGDFSYLWGNSLRELFPRRVFRTLSKWLLILQKWVDPEFRDERLWLFAITLHLAAQQFEKVVENLLTSRPAILWPHIDRYVAEFRLAGAPQFVDKMNTSDWRRLRRRLKLTQWIIQSRGKRHV